MLAEDKAGAEAILKSKGEDTVSLNAQKYTLGGGVVMGWPFSKIKSSKHPIWLTNA